MTVKEAAHTVLKEAGEPLRVDEITQRILDGDHWTTDGATPSATVGSILAVSIKRNGQESPFQRVAPATYALREWDVQSTKNNADVLQLGEERVQVPLFPTYANARHFLRILDRVSKQTYQAMISEIRDQTGTPQNPVNWQDPDTWIESRLRGATRDLAQRIWQESGKELNPRYTRGSYFLSNSYELLLPNNQGQLRRTEIGQRFMEGDPKITWQIDEAEGVGEILSILAPKTRAMRGDLLPEWSDYLREYSSFGKPSTFKDTLRRRLVNLLYRDYIERDGHTYVITSSGTEYAAAFAEDEGGDPKIEVQQALKEHNQAQREALREVLADMDPYLFEHLVRDLLEAMGYQDVEVTRQSGDRGVDVIATVQFGITTVKEVVQVKRHRGTISRPKIDQLRGALHYHDAIRGTLITLSRFSSSCKESALLPGAPPITLIDGERLLDLLVEHEIGMQKRPALLYEVDRRYFDVGNE